MISTCNVLSLYVLSSQIRLPTDVSDDVDEDPTGNKALWDRGLLNGASQKVCSHTFVRFYTPSPQPPHAPCITRLEHVHSL